MAVLEVVCVEFYHRECAFMITMSCRWVLHFSLALHTANSYCCGCMLHSVFQREMWSLALCERGHMGRYHRK